MEIDIISFTDEQFALLNETQVQEVENVQIKKNRLTLALAENKRKEKYRLLKNGIWRSGVYQKICDALDDRYDAEVEALRDGLLFYLRFSTRSEDASSAPYTVDYSLDYPARYNIVKDYYESTYSTRQERLDALNADAVALAYLGEYFMVLYNYFSL